MKLELWKRITPVLLAGSMLLSLPAAAFELNQPAPDFTLKSMDGENIKLSEMAGNVVLINFWASWCGPCREEMPLLNELHNKYEPLGFTVLGVNVEEDPKNARGFLKNFPVDFPVVLDNLNEVSRQYNVIAMPTTVVVDRDGNGRCANLHSSRKRCVAWVVQVPVCLFGAPDRNSL